MRFFHKRPPPGLFTGARRRFNRARAFSFSCEEGIYIRARVRGRVDPSNRLRVRVCVCVWSAGSESELLFFSGGAALQSKWRESVN